MGIFLSDIAIALTLFQNVTTRMWPESMHVSMCFVLTSGLRIRLPFSRSTEALSFNKKTLTRRAHTLTFTNIIPSYSSSPESLTPSLQE